MTRFFTFLLATAAVFCAGLAPLAAGAEDKPLTKEEVEAIVKKVIQENPELLMRTMQDFEQKELAERISKAAVNLQNMQPQIAHDPRAPTLGNPDGDVTITEFFDYHCGYCKRFYPELAKLLHDDKKVRIVFKEFPILTEGAPVDDSMHAAKAALAVWNLDKSKYFGYHIRLMQSPNDFTDEVLTQAAAQEGIDPEEFKRAYANPELDKDIENNKALAKDLSITGTPGIIIGTEFMPGAVSYDKLKEKVAEVRDNQAQLGLGGAKKED